MTKQYTKTFSSRDHMLNWLRSFQDDVYSCYEVEVESGYKLRFSVK